MGSNASSGPDAALSLLWSHFPECQSRCGGDRGQRDRSPHRRQAGIVVDRRCLEDHPCSEGATSPVNAGSASSHSKPSRRGRERRRWSEAEIGNTRQRLATARVGKIHAVGHVGVRSRDRDCLIRPCATTTLHKNGISACRCSVVVGCQYAVGGGVRPSPHRAHPAPVFRSSSGSAPRKLPANAFRLSSRRSRSPFYVRWAPVPFPAARTPTQIRSPNCGAFVSFS